MANASTNGTAQFPSGVMDSFLATAGQASPLMQVVLFVYRLLGTQFGLDPSVVLTTLGFAWAASKIGSQVYTQLQGFVDRHLMCAMFVSEHDHIYHHLMKWLSYQESIKNNRYLMAQTVWKGAWEEEEAELQNNLFWTDGGEGDGRGRYLNFSSQAARSSPRYVPAMGSSAFWHNRTYFRINRKKESFMNTSGWSAMKDLEEVKISCYGRSIEPIKRLLSDAKGFYYHDTQQKTAIYRPRAKEVRRDNNMWQQVARRPVRPMNTVVLDSDEKHGVLGDINEYLHPATPKWYASRGIPLRRGYLFHGPPGTGKTSFSFALAGVFGIDIYVISLQDINVTEEDLAVLFTKLPRRCIILLEDIDTAGLQREEEPQPGETPEEEEEEEAQKVNGVNGVKDDKDAKKKKGKGSKKRKSKDSDDSDDSDSRSEDDKRSKKKKGKKNGPSKGPGGFGRPSRVSIESISLSGLLNAIDGVASHEGRVLIMTTNKPESLDEALIRPGRVDVQVAFTNATPTQAGQLFHRMYEASWSRPLQEVGFGEKAAELPKVTKQEAQLEMEKELKVSATELREIADEFGRLVPEDTFSPAEIQGFLLKRKKTPRQALEDADAWIEAAKKQKEMRSKVVTVQ